MNTVKSVYYGWGALIVAGGGAYYFAKKSINADRAAKAEAGRQKRIAQHQMEAQYNKLPPTNAQQPLQSSASSTPASENNSTSTSIVGELEKAKKNREGGDWSEGAGGPSQEASIDPAPTRHAPEDENQQMREKSKYEANVVFRSRKGDRFS